MAVYGLVALGSALLGGIGSYSTAKKRHASTGTTVGATFVGAALGPLGWALTAVALPEKEDTFTKSEGAHEEGEAGQEHEAAYARHQPENPFQVHNYAEWKREFGRPPGMPQAH